MSYLIILLPSSTLKDSDCKSHHLHFEGELNSSAKPPAMEPPAMELSAMELPVMEL